MDIKCPHCGEEYIAESNEYGKFVKCETCGEGFIVGTSATKELGKAVQNIKNAARTITGAVKRQSGETGLRHATRLAIIGICIQMGIQACCLFGADRGCLPIVCIASWTMQLMFFLALYKRQTVK